ncbi:MAG: hypothetical protein U0487_01290 [Patescibacteria group bacterium]
MSNIRFALALPFVFAALTGCTVDSGNSLPTCHDTDTCNITCFRDADLDGVSTSQSTVFNNGFCDDGWVPYQGNDCDDHDVLKQYNCMTQQVFCYFDEDRDGWGVAPGNYFPGTACPDRYATNVGDCAPSDNTKHDNCTTCTPTSEICDGKDNDCDNAIDENGVCQCTPTTTTEAMTLCSNGKDDDCDGLIDSADPSCNVCQGTGALLGDSIGIEFYGLPSGLRTLGGQSVTNSNLQITVFGCANTNGSPQTCNVNQSCSFTLNASCVGWLEWTASQGSFSDLANIVSWDGRVNQDAGQMGIRVFVTKNGVTTNLGNGLSRIAPSPTCLKVASYQGIDPQYQGDRVLRFMTPVREDCANAAQGGSTPPNAYPGVSCN